MRLPGSILLLLFVVSFNVEALADVTIAVVGKTKNESFYMQSFKGCERVAEQHPDLKCLYDGPIDFQDPRGQEKAILPLIEKGIDGLLVSTTDSHHLVERVLKVAREKNIPVMTFDSDLLPEHHDYRLAYVGTNNFDFGVALGNYAKKFKKTGKNHICLQSGSQTTPNLNERIRGVRFALSGNETNKRLTGENGWVEYKRCPFYTLGQKPRALYQLEFILRQEKPPIFLAVAGFAQFSPDYIKKISPYKDRIKSGDLVIISADTEPVQLEALKQNLSTGNIGQRPFEMGRLGTELLYNYIKHQKKPENEINYLGFYYCYAGNDGKCDSD